MGVEDSPTGFEDSTAALSALNAVRHFVGLLSADGVLLEANAAALAAGGLRRDDVVGRPFWDADWWSYDPDVQSRLREAVARAARGEAVRYQVEVLGADEGRALLPIDFTLTPLVDDDGVIRHLVPEGHPLVEPGGAASSMSWAELVAQARQARTESDQLRALAAALAGVHGSESVASVIVDHLPRVLGVDFADVAVRSPEGFIRIHQPEDLAPDIAARWSVLAESVRTPSTDAIRTGRDVVCAGPAELSERYPDLVADAERLGLACVASHAVVDDAGEPRAAIGLGSAQPAGCDLSRFAPVLALCGAALLRAVAVEHVARTAALLDTLVRQAPLGFAFIDLDLRFAMVNERLAETNGISAADHVGKAIADVVPELADQAVPLLESVIATRTPVSGIHITGTTPVTEQPRTWEEAYFPVEAADGRILGVGAVVEDITERLASEQQVRALNERLRLALAISRAGVYQWIPDSDVIEWTAEYADLYGFDPAAEPSIEQWLGAVHPDDRRMLSEMIDALLAGEDEWNVEYRIEHPERGTRWVHSIVHPNRRADGTVATVIGINTDITERRVRESELEQLHAEQRQVAERLQAGLLPAVLPEVAGYDVSARYLPGTDGLRVGGDWYDLIVVDDDDFATVVDDVVGHDLDAAIAMAQLRHATVGLSYAHTDPAAVLADLDHLAVHNPGITASTLFYGRLDPRSGVLRYVLGGHHRPMLVTPGRPPALVGGTPGTPLGVPADRQVAEIVLEPGQLLLAYTDGLVEHRSEPLTTGVERLVGVTRTITPDIPLAEITRRVVAEVPHPDRSDDIALLALRRHPRD